MQKQFYLLLLLAFFMLCCKNKNTRLKEAEEMAKKDTSQAIKMVREVLRDAEGASDWVYAAKAGLVLGNIYRDAAGIEQSAYYDSIAIQFARKTKDSLLLQKVVISYANNLNDLAKVKEVEALLMKDSALFAKMHNAQTTYWYQIRGDALQKQMNLDGAIQDFRAAMPLAIH